MVNKDTRQIYGLISEIGIFRTQLRERVGGDGIDFERPTGRIITFPNNFIFRYPLTNFTKNHRILWHATSLTITFESDFELANSLINRTCSEVFEQLMAKTDKYFELGIGDLHSFHPKVYYSIDASGVNFSVWYACKIGMLRETLEKYTEALLHTFKENNIKLAYTTFRVTDK
jgi:small-conductance mechanosensitive channel